MSVTSIERFEAEVAAMPEASENTDGSVEVRETAKSDLEKASEVFSMVERLEGGPDAHMADLVRTANEFAAARPGNDEAFDEAKIADEAGAFMILEGKDCDDTARTLAEQPSEPLEEALEEIAEADPSGEAVRQITETLEAIEADTPINEESILKIKTVRETLTSLSWSSREFSQISELTHEEINSKEGRALQSELRGFRSVNSQYRSNNPASFQIDHYVAEAFLSGTNGSPMNEFYRGLVSDRPDAEREAMQHVANVLHLDPAMIESVVAVASVNETVSQREYDTSAQPDAEKQHLWRYAGDRQYSLGLLEKLNGLDESVVPGDLKQEITNMFLPRQEVRDDYGRNFLGDVETGTVGALVDIQRATGYDVTKRYVDLLRVTDKQGIKAMKSNLESGEFADLKSALSHLKTERADSALARNSHVIDSFVLSALSETDGFSKKVEIVRSVLGSDKLGVIENTVFEAVQDQILNNILRAQDPSLCLAGLEGFMSTPMIQAVLAGENKDITTKIVETIGAHTNRVADIGRLFSEVPPSKPMQEYIKGHLNQDALEMTLNSLEAQTGFDLPHDCNERALDTKVTELIGAVAGREGVDKLLTSESKLKAIMPNEKLRNAYMAVIRAKTEGSDVWAALAGSGLGDSAVESIRSSTGLDAAILFSDLRRIVARNKELSQVRDRWLREYAKQGIRTLTLTQAWQSRDFALAQGAGDSPRQISEWILQNGFKIYVEGLRNQGHNDLPSSEVIDNRKELVHALSRYRMDKALEAFRRFVADDREGKLYRADLAPGKVEVEVGGELFVAEVLSKTDPRGFTIGTDTGCCMTVGGASESCIWAGYEDPRYGFMTISKEGRLRAQSLLYVNGESTDGTVDNSVLVLDNIEANQGSDIGKLMQVYQTALRQLLNEGALNRNIRQVNLGQGYTDIDFSSLEIADPVPTPLEGVYSDARKQRLLLQV